MPSVNLSADTYEKLKDYAARHGTSTDEAAEWLLLRARTALLTPEQWNAEFDRLRARVQASIPDDVTEEEIQADIDRALREVRASRRARSR